MEQPAEMESVNSFPATPVSVSIFNGEGGGGDYM